MILGVTNQQFKLFDLINKFFTKNNYSWNHEEWLALIRDVQDAGININSEELGNLLENEKIRHERNIIMNELEKGLVKQFEDLVQEVVSLNIRRDNLKKEVNELSIKKEDMLTFFKEHHLNKEKFEAEKDSFENDKKFLEEEKKLLHESRATIDAEKKKLEQYENKILTNNTTNTHHPHDTDKLRKEVSEYEKVLKQKEDRLFEVEKAIERKIAKLKEKEDSLIKYEQIIDKKKGKKSWF